MASTNNSKSHSRDWNLCFMCQKNCSEQAWQYPINWIVAISPDNLNLCTLTWWITSWNYIIWVSYQTGCQLDEPCGFSGDNWQMQQCFNVLTDIYTLFFLALFNCCILLKIKLITIAITCEFNWLWWWLSNGSNHTNGGGGSACDMNGNVKLMFDDRVAWHEFCQGSAAKQEVDKAWQRQKQRASSLTSSSPVKSRWSSTLMNWTKSE